LGRISQLGHNSKNWVTCEKMVDEKMCHTWKNVRATVSADFIICFFFWSRVVKLLRRRVLGLQIVLILKIRYLLAQSR